MRRRLPHRPPRRRSEMLRWTVTKPVASTVPMPRRTWTALDQVWEQSYPGRRMQSQPMPQDCTDHRNSSHAAAHLATPPVPGVGSGHCASIGNMAAHEPNSEVDPGPFSALLTSKVGPGSSRQSPVFACIGVQVPAVTAGLGQTGGADRRHGGSVGGTHRQFRDHMHQVGECRQAWPTPPR